jgi:hypothetical protein
MIIGAGVFVSTGAAAANLAGWAHFCGVRVANEGVFPLEKG